MSSSDIWQAAYLIALSQGVSGSEAKVIANQAVDHWEEFEEDTN